MQFINDLINLTQGQLLIKYWYIWVSIVLLAISNILCKKFKNAK